MIKFYLKIYLSFLDLNCKLRQIKMVKKSKSQKKTKQHNHKKCSHLHKIYKTKRKTKDHDQIHKDLQLKNAAKLLNQEEDIELAGSGQHYCIHCA